jgi:hypothetical protein
VSNAVLVALITAAATGFGSAGLWAFLTSRRTSSGQVITTPAEVLWQQMQQLVTSTQARADKAEEQRDALLAGYTAISATLSSINSSLQRLLELAPNQEH